MSTVEIPQGWQKGYHFLREDMRSGSGDEGPWSDGEVRTYKGQVSICYSGYHWCRDWFDCLAYAPGSIACIVAAPLPVMEQNDKCVSQSRMLLAHKNVEKELRLFTCDCAERALQRERENGREPDERSWKAIEVARRYVAGEASDEEVASAKAASEFASKATAGAAARAAGATAEAAAWAAGAVAWEATAEAAAWAAAWEVTVETTAETAEREWQRQRFNEMMEAAFAEVAV